MTSIKSAEDLYFEKQGEVIKREGCIGCILVVVVEEDVDDEDDDNDEETNADFEK